MSDFANVDFTDRAAVEELFERASEEARKAWLDAARAAEGLRPQTSAAVAPAKQEATASLEQAAARQEQIVAFMGSFAAQAVATTLQLLKTQANVTTSFFTATAAAYRMLAEAATERGADDFQRALREFEQNAKALKETIGVQQDDPDTSHGSKSKRRAA